mmetsp:Transcript_23992/g.37616  ORF Transcript_23992/g.37616 Transcript_23992/m.37616 type:complete len:145 (+) Transcript_23992:310-744(+)
MNSSVGGDDAHAHLKQLRDEEWGSSASFDMDETDDDTAPLRSSSHDKSHRGDFNSQARNLIRGVMKGGSGRKKRDIELRRVSWADDTMIGEPLEQEFIIPPRPWSRRNMGQGQSYFCFVGTVLFMLFLIWILSPPGHRAGRHRL